MRLLPRAIWRWLWLTLVAALALQLFFIGRIALALWLDPQSTTLQRSELWRLALPPAADENSTGRPVTGWHWSQQWVDYGEISNHLKRAVITAEDDSFTSHEGVDWDAIERAWQRNAQAEEDAARRAEAKRPARPVRLSGGSTITQQLAKNLLLSGERTLLRKGQELLLTFALEHLLSKQRILEIYLNSVEWGQGIFGAEAAARHYFGKSAAQLSPTEAARLAVMLPAPKRFEKNPHSAYLNGRTRSIARRMGAAQLP